MIQNERYEEWMKTLKQLRKLFNEYDTRVLNYQKRPGYKTPRAYNSTAAQGNFLETLNMTLNCKLFSLASLCTKASLTAKNQYYSELLFKFGLNIFISFAKHIIRTIITLHNKQD